MRALNKKTTTWSYKNQENWCCETALLQSPINIKTSDVISMQDAGLIQLSYSHTIDTIVDTGNVIQGFAHGTANINQRFFTLQQFHFHSHSEHLIDGIHTPLEIHFVHESQSGRLAVLGVLAEIGEENETFQKILDNINLSKQIHHINLYDLLPTKSDYYHYLGSLTTPPLTENVEWYLFKQPIQVSLKQLMILRSHHKRNWRKTQPLNGRKVLLKEFHD